MNEDYPLFKKWSDILDWILDKCEKYPKNVRFTLSSRIASVSIEIIEKIIEAIYSKNKIELLTSININLEKLRVFFRISYNRRYISSSQYEFIIREMNEAGAMVGGWLKLIRGI